jgi:hypothetical protein
MWACLRVSGSWHRKLAQRAGGVARAACIPGGGSEEAAAVSQYRRGGRKREALGGIGRLVE